MKARFVDFKQNSPEWHAWRSSGIGASEAAAVLGVCKFKTPYQLWLEKTNRVPKFEGNVYTEAGKAVEPKARAEYEIQHDFIDMPEVCVVHPTHDFILASLDGWNAEEGRILELKYVSEATHAMALAGNVPEHYYPQTQHQLMCVPEAKELHYYSYRAGNSGKVVVQHDYDFQKKLELALISFWDLIKNDIPPQLTEKDAKLVLDNKEIEEICAELSNEKTTATKDELNAMKAKVIELGGHNKVRFKNILISATKTKTGKDSYRMTVSGGANV